MRVALDTNVLVYAEGFGDPARVGAIQELLQHLATADVLIPMQCLGELFRVLTGKAGRSNKQAQEAVLSWMDAFELVDSTVDAWCGAMDLCVAHQISSWDALVLNASAEGAARLLLSEDLNPGFSWRGVRVVNPLAKTPDPLLLRLLG
jgi:predicted nucleic acid-binding protein